MFTTTKIVLLVFEEPLQYCKVVLQFIQIYMKKVNETTFITFMLDQPNWLLCSFYFLGTVLVLSYTVLDKTPSTEWTLLSKSLKSVENRGKSES